MSDKIFLPGLNGLRAIAAMAVVFSHIGLNLEAFGLACYSWDLAGFGVTIFFALSGFLITYLLLLELHKTGRIAKKDFYARRVLRIWPLYFLYLTLALLVIFMEQETPLPGSLPFYIFLAANIPFIFNCALPHLDHYWSLAVEEQFYLFWPWVVNGTKRFLNFLIGFIACFLLLKFLARYYDIQSGNAIPYTILNVTRFDCMAIGALGAYMYNNKYEWFLRLCKHRGVQVLAWLVVVLLAVNKFHIASIIDSEIVAIITVILIINQTDRSATIVSLEKPLFDFLGKISFGIYVYHPLVIFFGVKFLPDVLAMQNNVVKYAVLYSIIIAATIIIAWLSYTYFEKWFLKLKTKYSTIHSAGSSAGY